MIMMCHLFSKEETINNNNNSNSNSNSNNNNLILKWKDPNLIGDWVKHRKFTLPKIAKLILASWFKRE